MRLACNLVPLKLKDGTESDIVYFLCDGGSNPFDVFVKDCRDGQAIEKMAKAIESVHTIGVGQSRCVDRLKKLRGNADADMYEITVNKCTARAYLFTIDGELAIAIAFIQSTTHSGTGKMDVKRAIEKLGRMRPRLDEALKRRDNHGKGI